MSLKTRTLPRFLQPTKTDLPPMLRPMTLAFFGFFSAALAAQQLPYQTQFRQLYSYINPAAINSDYFLYEYNTAINASYRLQWAAQPLTPRTFHLAGDWVQPKTRRRGAGFSLAGGGGLLRDQTGPLGVTSGYVRVASLLASDPYFGAFSLGFNVGLTSYRIDQSRIIWEDPGGDPLIPLDDVKKTAPEIGLGGYYFKRIRRGRFRGDNFYAGLSVPQLFAAQVEVESGPNQPPNLVPVTRVPHFYATGGWYHFFNEDSFLELSLWAKYVAPRRSNLHLTARFQPMRTFWIGGGGNLNGLVHLEAGVNLPGFLDENGSMKIGYAFDYNITAFDLPLGASHELHVSYLLDARRR